MSGDVLEKAPSQGCAELFDDPQDVGPEVALVVLSLALSCMAKWLTRVASQQRVDCACKRAGVEGGKVIPDRGGLEVSGPHRGNERRSGVFLDLDIAPTVETGFRKAEAHIQASGSGAEAKPVSGR